MPTIRSKVLKNEFKTIFLDLKESSTGRFVQLATRSNQGRQVVTIDLADLPELIETLSDFAEAAGVELPKKFASADLRTIRSKFPRAYKPWTDKEVRILSEEIADGKSVEEIAKFHQRQPSAIQSRIRVITSPISESPLAPRR